VQSQELRKLAPVLQTVATAAARAATRHEFNLADTYAP
jgi:hypothetical protein